MPITHTELSLGSFAGLNTTCRSGVIEKFCDSWNL